MLACQKRRLAPDSADWTTGLNRASRTSPRPSGGRGLVMDELLTDEQVAEFLQIPFVSGHIERLRSREKLPHVMFDVNGEKHYRYPASELHKWLSNRLRVGNRLINKAKQSQ